MRFLFYLPLVCAAWRDNLYVTPLLVIISWLPSLLKRGSQNLLPCGWRRCVCELKKDKQRMNLIKAWKTLKWQLEKFFLLSQDEKVSIFIRKKDKRFDDISNWKRRRKREKLWLKDKWKLCLCALLFFYYPSMKNLFKGVQWFSWSLKSFRIKSKELPTSWLSLNDSPTLTNLTTDHETISHQKQNQQKPIYRNGYFISKLWQLFSHPLSTPNYLTPT